ncbi:MAG: DUF1073 domain-containing protein [Acidobacteriota bacterium]|nr:DUF1073 domain-containing protein [Acidobacteriota bacterium]
MGGIWWAGGLEGGLSDETIDQLCRAQLMYRIVTLLVFDAMKVTPNLSGPQIGELDEVWDYMQARHWTDVEVRSLIYARQYGGSATILLVDDGRKMSEPIDLTGVRSVLGFMEVRKRYITPGPFCRTHQMTWWGPTIGRPLYYVVTPWTGDVDLDEPWRESAEREGVEFGSGTFSRIHPSRVIDYRYRPELDYLQARRFAQDRGWGPGVVEGVMDAYLARVRGVLRTGDIINSYGYDWLQMPGMHDTLSSPGGAAWMNNFVDSLKQCRDRTGDGVPVVVTGPEVKEIKSTTRNVSGLPDLLEAQRSFLLDSVEYPRVVLFGVAGGGLSGKDEGEWRTYYNLVRSYLEGTRWPGIRHAALVVMAAKDGPTGGVIDHGIVAAWPSIEEEREGDRAEARKRDTEAREKDAAILGLSPADLIRLDPTIEKAYPGIQAALENGLLRVQAAGPSSTVAPDDGTAATAGSSPAPSAPASAPSTSSPPSSPQETAADASVPMESQGLTGQASKPEDAAPPPPPTASIPTDLIKESEARKMLQCGAKTFAGWVAAGLIKPWYAGGGRRYSLAEVVEAASKPKPKMVAEAAAEGEDGDAEGADDDASASGRADAYRGDPYPSEHAARQRSPKGMTGFRRKNIAPGIDIISGKVGGKGPMVVQTLRFAASEWSPSEARAWLAEHDYKAGAFEAATGGRSDEEAALDGRLMDALAGRGGVA